MLAVTNLSSILAAANYMFSSSCRPPFLLAYENREQRGSENQRPKGALPAPKGVNTLPQGFLGSPRNAQASTKTLLYKSRCPTRTSLSRIGSPLSEHFAVVMIRIFTIFFSIINHQVSTISSENYASNMVIGSIFQ